MSLEGPHRKREKYVGAEKRRNPRVEVHLEAKIAVLPSDVNLPVSTTCLSDGGLRLSVRELIAPKKRVCLELKIPGQNPIALYGEVVWSDRRKPSRLDEPACEIGVRIIQVGSYGQDIIRRYVSSKQFV